MPYVHTSLPPQALKSLLLHVDVDDAYRTALGLYQLPLAYMVVHASSQVRDKT